jgi:Ran GTPase-activating protein (RanGAP) involved in mRNA processing and transport
METPDVMDLYKYMKYNHTLKHFTMTGTTVDSESVTALVEMLRVNKSVVKLHLWGNRIGSEGALTIIRGLEHNNSLQELRMVANNVGSEAAQAMADVLLTNESLTTVDFCSNRITDEGGKLLVAALKMNVTCRYFGIQNNPFSDNVKDAISFYVSLNNAGRQLLQCNVPKGLWANLLSRTNERHNSADVISYLLRAKPDLVL